MIQTDVIASIPELLRRHAKEQGSKQAFRDAASAVTYAELQSRSANLAGHLADHGVDDGAKVAIFLPSSVQWVESCLAVNRANAVAVPISYDSTESEILYRLQDARCSAIVTTDERAPIIAKLKQSVPELRLVILVDRGLPQGDGLRYGKLISSASKSTPRDSLDIHAPAFIIYTSGTTGRAKGVLLSVHSMLWVTAACWVPIAGLSKQDAVLSPLPLFHSYALNFSVLSILATGASEYIMEKYSTSEAVRLLQTGEFTVFPGVPTMFHFLLEATKKESGSSVFQNCGSAFRPAQSCRRRSTASSNKRFGVKLLDGYGITETSTMVTMNWLTGNRVMGSCGLPVPGLAVRIVSPATGDDVAIGEEGELIVRGPNLMSGYHNKPEETASAIRKGWYHTGDLARSDENGFLTITGRLKELIIRGGQNIAPGEIEEVVNAMEQVVDCAVVGIPHEHLGEVPAIFIVPREGKPAAPEDVVAFCSERLSSYKVPHSVHFISEIPRTGSGKIIRFKLREMLVAASK